MQHHHAQSSHCNTLNIIHLQGIVEPPRSVQRHERAYERAAFLSQQACSVISNTKAIKDALTRELRTPSTYTAISKRRVGRLCSSSQYLAHCAVYSRNPWQRHPIRCFFPSSQRCQTKLCRTLSVSWLCPIVRLHGCNLTMQIDPHIACSI